MDTQGGIGNLLAAAVAVRLTQVLGLPVWGRLTEMGPAVPPGSGDLIFPVTWRHGDQVGPGSVSLPRADARALAELAQGGGGSDEQGQALARQVALAAVEGLAEATQALTGQPVSGELDQGVAAGQEEQVAWSLAMRVADRFEAALVVGMPQALARQVKGRLPAGTAVARPAQLPELSPPPPMPPGASVPAATPPALERVLEVPLTITVELGRAVRRVEELLSLAPGYVLELDRLAGEPLDVYANQEWVARGEVVVVDENFAVRITQVGAQGRDGRREGEPWGPR
jgi:flagellar motor switch protein FliN